MTLDSVCDELIIHGSPDQVVDKLLAFRETVGDFGTFAGMSGAFVTPAWSRRAARDGAGRGAAA